eukprot:CAMPEP_0119152716 /NCGR_PEP_ID=MMETSP1310-20130426/48211_1 /TAXON_ID=464262 /ORGANISM="Genus nov. species nov., Strain RCC2339" /LENGTH=161 /DNA_ID=CAMNT_0007145109 /DNA_START=561 /DNA_END=1046 /DNA_ORIENTATION=+
MSRNEDVVNLFGPSKEWVVQGPPQQWIEDDLLHYAFELHSPQGRGSVRAVLDRSEATSTGGTVPVKCLKFCAVYSTKVEPKDDVDAESRSVMEELGENAELDLIVVVAPGYMIRQSLVKEQFAKSVAYARKVEKDLSSKYLDEFDEEFKRTADNEKHTSER